MEEALSGDVVVVQEKVDDRLSSLLYYNSLIDSYSGAARLCAF